MSKDIGNLNYLNEINREFQEAGNENRVFPRELIEEAYKRGRRPFPAVVVQILHPITGQHLLGRRLKDPSKGTYSYPGGHQEFGESFEDCAIREVDEETGLELEELHPIALMNLFNGEAHHTTLIMRGTAQDITKLTNREPDKCEGWHWYDENKYPDESLWNRIVGNLRSGNSILYMTITR